MSAKTLMRILGLALLLTASQVLAGPKIQHWIGANGSRVSPGWITHPAPALDPKAA